MNYNNKVFKPISNSNNSETSSDTIFEYKQVGRILTCIYSGGNVKIGQLIGNVDVSGIIDMRYQQINQNGDLSTGICQSTPEFMPDGKIRLHEEWQWTSGDLSSGHSILEEQ